MIPAQLVLSAAAARILQVPDMGMAFSFFAVFFVFVFIIIVVILARGMSGWNRVQRPVVTDTAFPPPPPPDTVLVKCQYCGTEQVWKEACIKCGAPLPKPQMGKA